MFGRYSDKKLMTEILSDTAFYFLHKFSIRSIVFLGIKHADQFCRRLVHADKETACPMLVCPPFEYKITFKLFHLFDYFIPTT